MIKSIIVDDERKHRETTRMLLETYCPNVEIIAEAEDKTTLLKVLSEHQPDLLFLDINLGSSTAFDILNELDEHINFKIVFVTASESYAVEGYKYDAIDYLLKPIKEKNLIEVVNKIEKQRSKSVPKEIIIDEIKQLYGGGVSSIKISVSDAKGVHVLKVHDIIYCQSNGNYTTFKMVDDTEIVISKNLKYFETQLEVYKFQRIHRSYLVNIDHILQVLRDDDGLVLMTNNEKLSLSKIHKKELFNLLNAL